MGMWVGRGRKARAAYGFDDIALVPGALTINPNEVDLSWELLEPVVQAWGNGDPRKFPNYEAGAWGPAEADVLLEREGRAWRRP